MKVSIIVPVFNEERTIKLILEKIKRSKLPNGLSKEIIVVDDGSTDQTSKILDENSKDLKIFRHIKNSGKGAAVQTGLGNSNGELIIIQDADLEYDPNDYERLLTPILKHQAQIVYGSRLIDYPLKLWGKDKTPMPSHWLGNKFLTWLTNLLYGANLTDMETCYKVFPKTMLQGIKLRSNQFNIEPEITAKFLKRGYQIKEIPIKVKPRSVEEGKKINWRHGFSAIWALVKYRFNE